MSRTLNWMNAEDIKQVYKETIDNINTIEDSIEKINTNVKDVQSSRDKVLWDDDNFWLFGEISDAYNEVFWIEKKDGNDAKIWKIEEIRNVYNEILIDDDDIEEKSLKTQINTLLDWIEEKKIIIDKFQKSIFWYEQDDENNPWEKKKIAWLFDNINSFHNSQKIKYNTFFKQIEKELKWWTTSIILAKNFSDNVKAYKITGILWQALFVIIVLLLIDRFDDVLTTLLWDKFWMDLMSHIPSFVLSIWLLIFIWNRRAEAKKLEESYKHKEVMATSYFWYKATIEDMDTAFDENDKSLMKKHMDNLLDAIKEDSSLFLSTKWENHPFLDLLKSFNKKWKIPILTGTIESDKMKIDIKQK